MKPQPELKPSLATTLRLTRAIISNPENWCKNANQKGNAYCVVGALSLFSAEWAPLIALCQATPDGYDVVCYNDHPKTTHADIMAVFDRAIAKAEGQS